jgi:NAD(P)-dependent dehydrogenase (short-subunit alcohol dehydrogenase family)
LTLEGKRVLILGGTSGIGLAVAEAAKAEGSDVVVVSSKQSRVDAALTLLGEDAQELGFKIFEVESEVQSVRLAHFLSVSGRCFN